MPSLVKANFNLGGGGISLLEQSVETRSANELVINAKFVALKEFMDKWSARLQPGATPPVTLNYSGNALSATNQPRLNQVSINAQSGLVYFDCQFSTARNIAVGGVDGEQSLIESSSNISLQSFSGAWTYLTSTRRSYAFSTNTSGSDTYTATLEFDYYSESRSISASSPQVLDIGKEQLTLATMFIGKPFNVRGNALVYRIEETQEEPDDLFIIETRDYWNNQFLKIGFARSLAVPQVIYSYSTTKGESGSNRYSLSANIRLLQGTGVGSAGLVTSDLTFP
jgi:hypothetical protein